MKTSYLAAAIVLSVLSLPAQIQNARIEGNLFDSSGAAIVSAKLILTNTKTQVQAQSETNASGFYNFPVVPPGFYSLSAESKGFRKEEVTNIEVTVGVVLRKDLVLE